MKTNQIIILSILLSTVSCYNKEDIEEHKEQNPILNTHEITASEAIEKLEDFLVALDSETKSGYSRSIESVSTINMAETGVKAVMDSLDCSSLVHLVNFSQNRGYAILAADDRIDIDVLAFTDSCSLTHQELEHTFDKVLEEVIIVGANNSGQIDTMGVINQMDINPDNTQIANTLPTENTHEYKATEELVNSLVLRYALEGVVNANNHRFETEIGDMVVVGDTGSEGFTNDNPETITVVEVSRRKTYNIIVPPMLEEMKMWSQDSPFNNRYPNKLSGEKCDAGCFPLAISKIMTYFEHPNVLIYNGLQVDWYQLKYYLDSNSAAVLLDMIADNCGALYFEEGTFVFPCAAKCFLAKYYQNVKLQNYESDVVCNSIQSGCPIIISAIPKETTLIEDLFKGHAWTLDGMLTCKTTITNEYYQNGEYLRRSNYSETHNYYHCNFGWEDLYCGYYPDGVFDNTNESVIFDNPNAQRPNEHKYCRFLSIITYDKP